jgi:hypothetical protein
VKIKLGGGGFGGGSCSPSSGRCAEQWPLPARGRQGSSEPLACAPPANSNRASSTSDGMQPMTASPTMVAASTEARAAPGRS